MALQKKNMVKDVKVKTPSVLISKTELRQSLTKLMRKEIKSNLSIPLGPSLVKRYSLLAERFGIPRSELIRFALEFVLSTEDFVQMLEETQATDPADLAESEDDD